MTKVNKDKLEVKEYISKDGSYYLDYASDNLEDINIGVEIVKLVWDDKFQEELDEAVRMSKMQKQ